jgi:hypothetical protein
MGWFFSQNNIREVLYRGDDDDDRVIKKILFIGLPDGKKESILHGTHMSAILLDDYFTQ